MVYGTCSATTPYGDCIICPNRFYANNFETLKKVSYDSFGNVNVINYSQYIKIQEDLFDVIVLLGMHSGHEVKIQTKCSMDWVLAHVKNRKIIEYTGVEVQSIDITNIYRDNWYAYKNIEQTSTIPASEHGLNWANVYKRMIPQIIRKGIIYSKSKFVKHGLYFITPEAVYKKIEEIIGSDIPTYTTSAPDIITVHTYDLGKQVDEGSMRNLVISRILRFKLDDFSNRFITGPNLPKSIVLDNAVMTALGLM